MSVNQAPDLHSELPKTDNQWLYSKTQRDINYDDNSVRHRDRLTEQQTDEQTVVSIGKKSN